MATVNVTLSPEALEFVQAKISNGEYSSESDVVLDGIEALRQEAQERERWEREVVGPTYDRMMANPDSAISSERVTDMLEEARQARRARSEDRV